jgi:hypothetical protein
MSGEGELPVDDEFVYLTGQFVDGLRVERYPTLGTHIAAQRIAKADFIDAIQGLFTCFSFAADRRPRTLCDTAALSDYAARSPLHRYLANAGGGS